MPAIEVLQIDNLKDAIESSKCEGKVLEPYPKPQNQEGPNCGFYALSIVMEYWKAKGAVKQTIPARKRDVAASGSTEASTSLRSVGKSVGASI